MNFYLCQLIGYECFLVTMIVVLQVVTYKHDFGNCIILFFALVLALIFYFYFYFYFIFVRLLARSQQ